MKKAIPRALAIVIIFSGPKERLLEIALVPKIQDYIFTGNARLQPQGAEKTGHAPPVLRAWRSRWEGGEQSTRLFKKIKVASNVCDLYEGNHKAVIFRKMKADEQRVTCHVLDGRMCLIKCLFSSS